MFMFHINALIIGTTVCILSFWSFSKKKDFFQERDSKGELVYPKYFLDPRIFNEPIEDLNKKLAQESVNVQTNRKTAEISSNESNKNNNP